MSDEMVLNTSDKAARRITVEGWVSRDGRFYGEDERIARYAGCTHVECGECRAPARKGRIYCPECEGRRAQARYDTLPRAEWDGSSLIYSEVADEYFSDVDYLLDHCEEHGVRPSELRLVHCEPEYIRPIDPWDHCADELPEDGDPPDWFCDMVGKVNAEIERRKEVLSWVPGKVAVGPLSIEDLEEDAA